MSFVVFSFFVSSSEKMKYAIQKVSTVVLMQELVQLMEHAQLETSQPSELKKVLLKSQSDLNHLLFAGQSPDAINSSLKSVWKFFLFAASNAPSSLKTTVYRAAGSFLLKVTPYYPVEVRKAFSEVSTVLTKGSGLVACSFAFLSTTVALPALEEFLDSTSVYHNFTVADPVFQEHLVAIIRRLGRLSVDWFRTMLHRFLPLIVPGSDRSVMKVIAALVEHYPVELMKEVLDYVGAQENSRSYLGLIAFILGSYKRSVEVFDLFDVAKLALGILGNSESASLTDVDASLQILSLENPSFNLQIQAVDDENVKLTLTGGNMITEVEEIVWNVVHYRARPSLYLLRLPVEYLVPKYEKDVPQTLNAKFVAMSSLVRHDPSAAQRFLEVLENHVTGKYSEVVSAAIRGMAKCLSVLLVQCDKTRVVKLIKDIIFSSGESWLNLLDVLRLIKAIPAADYLDLFGLSGVTKLFEMVIDWCVASNDKLAAKAAKVVTKMACEEYFEGLTMWIAQATDPFEPATYVKQLTILCKILDTYPEFETANLCALVSAVMESIDMYAHNFDVLSTIFEFLGHFDLSFVSDNLLSKCQKMAFTIITATFKIFSGETWTELVEQSAMQKIEAILDNEIKGEGLDTLLEDSFGYQTCYRPCRTAAMLVAASPPTALDKGSVVQLCKRLMLLFPQETVRIMQRYWNTLAQADKAILLEQGGQRIQYIQDYEITARLCELFMQCCEECREKIQKTKAALLGFARFALANKLQAAVTPKQEAVFLGFICFADKQNFVREPDFEAKIAKFCPDLCPVILGKKSDTTTMKQKRQAVINLPSDIHIASVDSAGLTSKREIGDPIIKAQLRQNCYDFDKNTLQKLFSYYCNTEDHSGVLAVLKYSVTRKMLVSIADNVIPSQSAAIVLKYLKNMNSPELETLTERCLATSSNKDIICAAIAADPEKFLSDLLSDQKISKTSLKNFAFASLSVPFEHDEFQDTVMKCLKITKSKKKWNYLLATVANMLSVSQSASEELIDAVLKFCTEKHDDISPMLVALCLHNLTPLIQNEGQLHRIETEMAMFPFVSPMTARILQALSRSESGGCIFERDVVKLTGELLNKKLPSKFCAATRLLAAGLACLPEKKVQTLMSECFKKFLQNYPKCVDYSGVPEIAGRTLMAVLSMPALKRYYTSILSAAQQLIPMPSQACFGPMSLCITQIIELTTGSKDFVPVRQAMMTRVRALLTRPACVFLSKMYLMVVAVIAERTSNEREREKYVMNLVNQWLKRGLTQRDSYYAGEICYEWCATVSRYATFEQLLPLLTKNLFTNTNRFFPVFVGVARFIKKFASSHDDTDKVEQIRTELLNSATAMESTCKAHAMALRLLAGKGPIQLATDLARFDRDCPDSDKLICSLTQSPEPPEPVGQVDELIDLSPINQTPVSSASTSPFLFDEIVVNPAPSIPQVSNLFEDIVTQQPEQECNLLEPLTRSMDMFEIIPTVPSPVALFEEIPHERTSEDTSDLFEAITPRGDAADLDPFETIPPDEFTDQFEAIPQDDLLDFVPDASPQPTPHVNQSASDLLEF